MTKAIEQGTSVVTEDGRRLTMDEAVEYLKDTDRELLRELGISEESIDDVIALRRETYARWREEALRDVERFVLSGTARLQ